VRFLGPRNLVVQKRRATKAPLCNEEQNVPPLDDAFDSNPGHNQVGEEALESPESADNKSQQSDNSSSPESLKIDLTRSLSISPSKTGDEMELELHLNQVGEEALESPESADNKSQQSDNSSSPESLKSDLTRSLSISPSKTGDEMELELHLPPSNQLHSL